MRAKLLTLITVLALASLSLAAQGKAKPKTAAAGDVITIPNSSPLCNVAIMIRAGSAEDPAGKEGTARLTGAALIEGGFGDPGAPVTKEKLAEITRPWGERAMPQVLVDKETTTFAMTVPRDAFPQFVREVLKPMFTAPRWTPAEVDRLRREALVSIQSGLRLENQEMLGLLALDNYVFEGTPLGHLAAGTVQGLNAATGDDLAAFYKKYYTRGNMVVGISTTDPKAREMVLAALPEGAAAAEPSIVPPAVRGHELLIIATPNAIATGIHFGYPIDLKRGDPDYWPLFVANTFLGLHRDSFGTLYEDIRGKRGYNYGDYSYIEYLYGRPYFLFPPPNTPRGQQYFSIWIRPVGHQYAHFILKAATAKLASFAVHGMTPEQVAETKVRARTLYLNYAASTERQLGYRLDDAFYGMSGHGYLQEMIRNIDAVTPEQVNAAIKKYLQVENLKYVVTTNDAEAEKLAKDIADDTGVTPKTPEEYHMTPPITPDKQAILDQDKEWAAYPLGLPAARIYVVKTEQMFETTAIPGITKTETGAGQ